MQREYKVNITETVMRHMWVRAEDPREAIAIAEQACSTSDVLDIEFDVDPTARRERQ